MKSITLKLWAGMMILVVLVLILLWSFQINFLEKQYTDQKIFEVKKRGEYIVENIIEINQEDIQTKIDELVYNYNANVEMMDIEGEILYTSFLGKQIFNRDNNKRRMINREVLEGQKVVAELTQQRFNTQYVIIGIPIKIGEQLAGGLIIDVPLAPVRDTVYILKRQLIYVLIILFLVSIVLTLLLARILIKPILKITKATELIARGNLNIEIKTKSKDEIGKLAKSINYMCKELSKIDKLRKEFIANISHDLRTPISLIRGYAETIKDVTGENAQKREKQLNVIINESERLSNMVNDVLYLSQIQSHTINVKLESFNIGEVVENIKDRFSILSNEKNIIIEIENKLEEEVYADQEKIERVIYNFISNSFAHTKSGDKITLNLQKINDKIKVEVRDTGEGIDAVDFEHIWERYYKTKKIRDNRIGGSGLGLAIVKSILELHKSEYGVESEKGKGTIFWFTLKLQDKQKS